MFRKASLALLSPFVAWVFTIGTLSTTLPACGEAEKLYNEATGNVADEGAVRRALAEVNTHASDAIAKMTTMATAIQTAETAADKGDSATTASIWIDTIAPNADGMLASIDSLSNAEKTIQDNLSKARSVGRENGFFFIGAVIAVAGLAAFGSYCKRKGDEMKELKRQEGDAIAAGDSDALNQIKNKEIKVGQDVGNELGKQIIMQGITSGVGKIPHPNAPAIGQGISIVDTGGDVKREIDENNKVNVVGSSGDCQGAQRMIERGAAFSDSNCMVFIGKATPIQPLHVVSGVPIGQWDFMGFINGISRIYQTGVDVVDSIRTKILKGLIPIDQTTMDKLKANENNGNYADPNALPPPEEISVSATGAASGGYSSSAQDRTIDGGSQLSGYTVTGVSVNLNWQAYTIPDRFRIIYEGNTLTDTGNTSGGGTSSADASGSASRVTIRVTTPQGGTAWNWSATVTYYAVK
ncbi:MAG: hypothetical protein HQK87_03705 [Nitrospinae bacterium]|nr:hypothetical protein [Nitrospinota bacterium]